MILIFALISAALHIGIAAFQVFLAAGKPWGEYAFGGQNKGVLPRHLRIIFDLNARFLATLHESHPGEPDLLRRVSLIDEHGPRRVRMAYLCVLASHKVNGVSALHSELMRQTIFADFARLFPQRFCNKTNGVTPRRWLAQANRPLATLIDDRIGPAWRRDLDELGALRELANEPAFNNAVRLAKQQNKRRLADYISRMAVAGN